MDTNESTNDGVLDSTFRADGPEIDEGLPGDEPATTEPVAPEGQPQKVSLSRREKARERDERILQRVADLDEKQAVRDREYRESLDAIRRENAELRGYVAGQGPRQAAPVRDDSPDPEKLQQEAIAALDNKDFAGYQRKTIEAAEARILRNPRFAQQPQQQAPQQDPMLVATAAQYPDVMGNPDALEMAMAHDRILARKNIPNGPARWRQAFEEGRKFVGGTKTNGGPTYSQRNAAVVSGVPSGGSGGARSGGGEPGVILTAEERVTAKKYRISEQDYAKELAAAKPERVVK